MWLIVVFGFLMILSSCEDQITSTCNTDELSFPQNGPITFAKIQDNVFTPKCVSCHGGALTNADLDLSEGNAYANLVGTPSTTSNLNRVEPGDIENSHLIERLTGANDVAIMPPSGKLEQAVIDSIAAWIDRGASEN